MSRFRARFAVVVGVLGVVAMIVASPASAATPGTGVVIGSGTISPGLDPVVARPQVVTFTGTLRGQTTNNTFLAGGLSCSFNGQSTIDETDALGEGDVTGFCAGNDDLTGASISAGTTNVRCQLHYRRVGGVVHVGGGCTAGAVNGSVVGVFVFEPTSSPVTSYLLQGSVTIT